MEIKSAQTVNSESYANLLYYLRLSGHERAPAALSYGGDQAYLRSRIATYPWFVL